MNSPKLATSLVILAMVGCGHAVDSGTQAVDSNAVRSSWVVSLTANPSVIAPGASAQLLPHFTRGVGSISPDGSSVTSDVPVTVQPAATTTYTLTVSTWGGLVKKTATATVTVSASPPPVGVSIAPAGATLATGARQLFTASVSNAADPSVAWSVQEAGGGTVAADGTYTAPLTAGIYHVTATSAADPAASATATATVVAPPAIQGFAASPTSIAAGGTATLSATYSGGAGSIDQGVGALASGASVTVKPPATTTYTLTVSGAGLTVTRAITVTVAAAPAPVAVSIFPATATVVASGTQAFSATVSNTANSGVTWSVQEAGGGAVNASGVYTAPAVAGTYHVVATSAADPTKSAAATVTVTAASIAVSIAPAAVTVEPGAAQAFTAAVTGAAAGVTWSVLEAGGGSVGSAGNYVAPATEGTYHVVATSVADPTKSAAATVTVSALSILTADRRTVWKPGMMALGGIPNRTTICATVQASTYGNGAQDATAGISAAIAACPAGQVVQLSAGTFTVNGGNYILINKGITLRGAGPTQTLLQKTDGAKPATELPGPNPSPIIIVGPARWSPQPDTFSTNLTADAAKGAFSVTVASASGFSVGQIVLLDELSGASWQSDARGQVWASPDGRVTWQLHNPPQPTDDPLTATTPTSGPAASWFCRQDRPTSEIKKIASISGNTITFDTPIHISYRTSHTAQLSRWWTAHTKGAGVEDLAVVGGDNGQIRFEWAAESWARNIDNSCWHDEGFAIDNSFRVEIRDSYVHDAAWAQPGGAGYAISLAGGSSEILVENSISVRANKVMVARSSGAGSVFGYNYVDEGYINTNDGWIEVGLNASHMVGPHHVLFEGNYGFNWDSDKTHGSAIYHTVFRNHLRCIRAPFTNPLDKSLIDDAHQGGGPRRCAGAGYYSYWMSFIGNVLGAPGQMAGYSYEVDAEFGGDAIWKLGWDDWNPYPVDPQVRLTTVRHGNFDYLTNSVVWDPNTPSHFLPPSLYLTQKPAFFNAGRGYTWPWVDPAGSQQLYTLPAKARYDAGTPFTQP